MQPLSGYRSFCNFRGRYPPKRRVLQSIGAGAHRTAHYQDTDNGQPNKRQKERQYTRLGAHEITTLFRRPKALDWRSPMSGPRLCGALAVPHKQEAKSWELRAGVNMARLRRDQGKRDEARELLAPVYGLVHRGVRHARSERGEGAARRTSVIRLCPRRFISPHQARKTALQ